MNEGRRVLDGMTERWDASQEAGPCQRTPDELHLLDGKLVLRVEVHHDETSPAAIVHAKVVAKTEEGQLHTSVVAVQAQRDAALVAAGRTFMDLAVGPVVSWVVGRPVWGARAIAAHDGIHAAGFIGPCQWQGSPAPDSPDAAQGFAFAEAWASPGPLHIAKFVLDIRPEGAIRTLTVDDDAPLATEWSNDDALARAGARRGLALRYAVFGDRDPHKQRRDHELEVAITTGVAARLAQTTSRRLRLMVPVAFARLIHEGAAPLSSTYVRLMANGTTVEAPLANERVFARAYRHGQHLIETPEGVQQVQQLARLAPDLAAIEHALNHGSELDQLQPIPPVIPDDDVPAELVQSVLRARFE